MTTIKATKRKERRTFFYSSSVSGYVSVPSVSGRGRRAYKREVPCHSALTLQRGWFTCDPFARRSRLRSDIKPGMDHWFPTAQYIHIYIASNRVISHQSNKSFFSKHFVVISITSGFLVGSESIHSTGLLTSV